MAEAHPARPGWLGAGIIFVRRDSVRGLITTAGVWVTAAVGAAAGAGLPAIAALATGVYLLVALAFPLLTRRLPRSATAISVVQVYYPGRYDLAAGLSEIAGSGPSLRTTRIRRVSNDRRQPAPSEERPVQRVVRVPAAARSAVAVMITATPSSAAGR